VTDLVLVVGCASRKGALISPIVAEQACATVGGLRLLLLLCVAA
jgi:hypothetical protein